MAIFNKRDAYGWVAILLHWLLFLLIIGLMASGKYAESVASFSKKSQIITIHQQMGGAVFILVLFSMMWRFINPNVESIGAGFIKFINFLIHWTLYLMILAQVCLGISIAQLSDVKISLLGWKLPTNFSENVYPLFSKFDFLLATPIGNNKKDMIIALNDFHGIGAWAIIALVGGHVFLTLLQRVASDGDILKRMWFGYKPFYARKNKLLD